MSQFCTDPLIMVGTFHRTQVMRIIFLIAVIKFSHNGFYPLASTISYYFILIWACNSISCYLFEMFCNTGVSLCSFAEFISFLTHGFKGGFPKWTPHNLPGCFLFLKYGEVFIDDSKQEGICFLPGGVCVCMNFSDERRNKSQAHTHHLHVPFKLSGKTQCL